MVDVNDGTLESRMHVPENVYVCFLGLYISTSMTCDLMMRMRYFIVSQITHNTNNMLNDPFNTTTCYHQAPHCLLIMSTRGNM